MPSRDAALAFKEGDILQVLNQEDPNWWQVHVHFTPGSACAVFSNCMYMYVTSKIRCQSVLDLRIENALKAGVLIIFGIDTSMLVDQAKKVDEDGTSGLIPSQTLEEKRKAFVRPEYDYTHKSCTFTQNCFLY